MQVKKIGNIYGFTGGCYAGNVYDNKGLAPNFNGMEGGNRQPMIVAMRGRNPENPSDRRAGIELEQRLEPQKEGICNTLTSVCKDNLVLEGNYNQRGKVHTENDICRTILGCGHAGNEPKVLIRKDTEERKVVEQKPISTKGKEIEVASTILEGYHRTNITGFNADNGVCETVKNIGNLNPSGRGQNGKVIDSTGLARTVTVEKGEGQKVLIRQATDKGYIECKIGGVADLSFPNSTTRRGRVQDGGDVSPGLTVSGVDGICRIEEPKVIGGIGEKKSNGGSQYFQQDRVYTSDGLAMSHPAQIPGGSYKYMSDYRIRKLTPLECWRLMGFTGEEFHKAEAVNSNTQLYKQAGNSIVVDVLQYIFKEIIEAMEEEEMKKIEEVKTVKFETDKMINLAKLQEAEPELFEELAADYPCEDATYIFKVQSVG